MFDSRLRARRRGVGRACASTRDGSRFLDRHLDRLFEGAKAIAMDIGLTSRGADAAALRDARRQRHERRRPHPADGDARRALDALPGSARGGVAGDHRHHPRIQGAAAETCTSRASSCSPSMSAAAIRRCRTRSSTRIPSSTASSPGSRRPQAGADEALMLDPHGFVATCNSTHFFIVREGRGVDVERQILPRRDHPRPGVIEVCREAAFRCSRRTSR